MKNNTLNFINTVAIYLYTIAFIAYAIPFINQIANIFVGIGIWATVLGVWGNIAKISISSEFFLNDYRKENYFVLGLGIVFLITGVVILLIKSI